MRLTVTLDVFKSIFTSITKSINIRLTVTLDVFKFILIIPLGTQGTD